MIGLFDTSKSRSYAVRRQMARTLGCAQHTDLRFGMGGLPVVFEDGQIAMLLSTSNVGFGGIEGRFTIDGETRCRSLGFVVAFEDWDGGMVEVDR
jgi:hypothetical protein